MPDSYRPSNAPLSESEADRLSERFTASWEEPGEEGEAGLAAPSGASAATSSPPPVAEPVPTLPLPAVTSEPEPEAKPKPKPTLLGIAPIVIGPSSAPPPAPPAPLPAPSSRPVGAAPDVVPPSPPSSPESSVARGLTTPAKPYVPKDDPSTPAVVISDAARAPDRARIAQTLPGQTRSSPLSSPVSVAPPLSARAEVEDTYPPLRGRSKLPFLFGGLAVLGVAAFAVAKLNGDKAPALEIAKTKSEPSAASPPPAPPVSTTTAGSEPAAKSEPTPSASAPPSAEPRRVAAAPLPEPKPTKSVATKKSGTSLAPPRKATKADTKSGSEPSPSKKGVIVRETPF